MDPAIAQTTQAVAKATPTLSPAIVSLATWVPIIALFYFLLIYPQGKEKKKREAMLSSVQRGDRVLTRGGLYGTVADIKEQILVLKINENNKVEIDRSYIETVQKGS